MQEYEIDLEQECPNCGHVGSHYRDCDSLNCFEGFSDENFDDPINSPEEGVDFYTCPECKGRGVIEWCPECGYDYSPEDFEQKCRVCGCTENDACFNAETGKCCSWAGENLCSFCEGKVND